MTRAAQIERLLSDTVHLCEAAAAKPQVLQHVISHLRRPTNAQEVDAMLSALAELLEGMSALLPEEAPS